MKEFLLCHNVPQLVHIGVENTSLVLQLPRNQIHGIEFGGLFIRLHVSLDVLVNDNIQIVVAERRYMQIFLANLVRVATVQMSYKVFYVQF